MLKRIETPEIAYLISAAVDLAEAIAGCPLSHLHENYKPETAKRLSASVGPIVRDMAESLTPEDDYVQRTPNLRIHSPGGDAAVQYHSDVSLGHSPEETNYWFVLTKAWGSNSLWMADPKKTQRLDDALCSGMGLKEFEVMAAEGASPIVADGPGLYTFCCANYHGSIPNTTGSTRVSFDIRTIPASAKAPIKRKGAYFAPRWLRSWPHPVSDLVTTVASLDLSARVDHQRLTMNSFYPQTQNRELVEFHGLTDTMPTTADAMHRGPVILYSIRQLRGHVTLKYPLGCADERVWFIPGDEMLMERLRRECSDAPVERFSSLSI